MANTTPEEVFDEVNYLGFDKIRYDHFDTLNIDLKGKVVLELGSGIGNHTLFLQSKTPKKIITLEGREDNMVVLKERVGKDKSIVPMLVDLEKPFTINEHVDFIYNYGLLYHLKNPFEFIDNLNKNVKHDEMILETCIELDGDENNLNEVQYAQSQSLSGVGSRPNLYKLVDKLKEYYSTVYYPAPPKHGWFDIHAKPSPVLKRIVIICKK